MQRSRRKHLPNFLLSACIAGLLPFSASRAVEEIPLTAIDAYPPTASWVQLFSSYFIPEVDRRLAETGNYRIRWNQAFGTIAEMRGVLEALQYDLADIGFVTTPFHGDKVPFFNLGYVTPFVTTDIGLVARTISTLVERYPEVARIWDDYDQVYLTTTGIVDTYQVLLAAEPDSPSELRGKKIGGVGLNLRYLEGLNASGVTIGLNDWYSNLDTGLLDGIVGWIEAIVDFRLYEVAPYLVDVRLGAVTSQVINVNGRTWRRLPEEVRVALLDTAIAFREELARDVDRGALQSREEFSRAGGTIIPVSDPERKRWADSLPNMAQAWASDMEARGLPGRQMLRDYMDIMRANDQPIVRHWDRE